MWIRHIHARLPQGIEIGGWKRLAADRIGHEADAHPALGRGDQPVAEHLAQLVVMDDEELDENIMLCPVDGSEDRVEARLTVDQRRQRVATHGRQFGNAFERSRVDMEGCFGPVRSAEIAHAFDHALADAA